MIWTGKKTVTFRKRGDKKKGEGYWRILIAGSSKLYSNIEIYTRRYLRSRSSDFIGIQILICSYL